MAAEPFAITENPRILLSRNSPVALIYGVGGFIGSSLADELLAKGIQVVGLDDFSLGFRDNLTEATKQKKFHLINQSMTTPLKLSLPRLDYAFFITDKSPHEIRPLLKTGLSHFLDFCLELAPKIVLVSSIELYESKPPRQLEDLRTAEVYLANFVRDHKLNGRIVRLAEVFGPRMHFRSDDPMTRLIKASLLGKLDKEEPTSSFLTRSLYIDDAVALILKTIFAGATSQKIYDGARLQPIQVTEIKQLLLDPVWFEEKGFKVTPLPAWPTPNLNKSVKELAWRPKTALITSLKQTISYFKQGQVDLGARLAEPERPSFILGRKDEDQIKETTVEKKSDLGKQKEGSQPQKFLSKKLVLILGCLAIISYALILPLFNFGFAAVRIAQDLSQANQAVQTGNFDLAKTKVKAAQSASDDLANLVKSLGVLHKVGFIDPKLTAGEQAVEALEEGINGVGHAINGAEQLSQTSRIISGEKEGDLAALYQQAQIELTAAGTDINQASSTVNDPAFLAQVPGYWSTQFKDYGQKLATFSELVDKSKLMATLLPDITAINGTKSYLVLLQNNLELRPTGGFIGSYGQLDFEKGKIKNLKVDDIYNLDGNLKEHVEPPAEIKSDLGQKDYFLRDSNFEPDFPTSANTAQFFYKKEAGREVDGVIGIDLTTSANLIDAVGGLDLPDYGEQVNKDNLFAKVISHAEVGFFPGSQAKRNYLTDLENTLFNKIFFLSKQNWPAILQAVNQSFSQKHLLVYLNDPTLESYIKSAGWSGAFPKPTLADNGSAASVSGQINDFLAVVDANLGANKANYYLQRSYTLATSLGTDGGVFHKLKLTYQNSSPSDVFPAGTYKNRLRVYLPLGTKLTRATVGETDILPQVTSFSDYGRTGYSLLVTVPPKQIQTLILEYQLANKLGFDSGDQTVYQLNLLKQPGTFQDSFSWQFTYPINEKVTEVDGGDSSLSNQEVEVDTSLLTDKTFTINLAKQ